MVGPLSSEENCSGSPENAPSNSVQAQAARIVSSLPPLRVVFMGTPVFAATILERLLDSPQLTVCAAYTQPDKPAGRGKALTAPPVKELAHSRGIPVLQPSHFKSNPEGDAAFAELAAFAPDVLVVAAYGLLLPQRVLDIARLMPVNVHASLLPRYRGAAPIQRAIMNGDAVTGITIMRMEAALDSGPILMQRAVGIGIHDSSASLHAELAQEGAELLLLALERLAAGLLQPLEQDASRATYASKLRKEESSIDLTLSPRVLHAHIRALTPWPGATLTLCRKAEEDLRVQVEPGVFPLPPDVLRLAELLRIDPFSGKLSTHTPGGGAPEEPGLPPFTAAPGQVLGLYQNALLIACGNGGCYAVSSLRPAGRKSMDGRAFYNGYLKGFAEVFFNVIRPPQSTCEATPPSQHTPQRP